MKNGYGFKPDNLRRVLRERNISFSQIERDIGIPRSVLSRCMNGHSELSLKNAVLLANYFNTSIDYIIGRAQHSNERRLKCSACVKRKALIRQLDDTLNRIENAKNEAIKIVNELEKTETDRNICV